MNPTEKVGQRGRRREKGSGEEHERTGWPRRGRREGESKQRDILIEGVLMGLASNWSLGNFPGIHKGDPNKDPKQ